NASPGSPKGATTLRLTGLPPHTSIDLDFLLAVIDSWDGSNATSGPDLFNVTVDEKSIFSETFTNVGGSQSYVPPAGVRLSAGTDRGFAAFPDSIYDLGRDVKRF